MLVLAVSLKSANPRLQFEVRFGVVCKVVDKTQEEVNQITGLYLVPTRTARVRLYRRLQRPRMQRSEISGKQLRR